MTKYPNPELAEFEDLLAGLRLGATQFLPTTRREFISLSALTVAASASAVASAKAEDDGRRPTINVHITGKSAQIDYQGNRWTLEARKFGRDCTIVLTQSKDECTLTIKGAVSPLDNRPFTPVFRIYFDRGTWKIAAKLDNLSASPRSLFDAKRALDLGDWINGKKIFKTTLKLSDTKNLIARLAKDAVVLAPRMNTTKAPARFMLHRDGVLEVNALPVAFGSRLKEAFYFPDANGSSDRFIVMFDPEREPEEHGAFTSNERDQTTIPSATIRDIVLLTKLYFETDLYVGSSTEYGLKEDGKTKEELYNHHWIAGLKSIASLPVAISIPFDATDESAEAPILRTVLFHINRDDGRGADGTVNPLQYFSSEIENPEDLSAETTNSRGDFGVEHDALVFGPVNVRSLSVVLKTANRKFSFNASGGLGKLDRPRGEIIPVDTKRKKWKKRHKAVGLQLKGLNKCDDTYRVKTGIGTLTAAFAELTCNDPEQYEFRLQAAKESAPIIHTRLPVLAVPAAVAGADFSRLDFEDVTRDVDLTIAHGAEVQSAAEYDPDGKLIGRLLIRRSAELSIPLDKARLQVGRTSDLLALNFKFRLLTLQINEDGVFITPAVAKPSKADDVADTPFANLANNVKPSLIVEFPPQHIAEQAYFRTTRNGSIKNNNDSDLSNLPDVDLPTDTIATLLDVEVQKSLQSPEYFYFKLLFREAALHPSNPNFQDYKTILRDFYKDGEPNHDGIRKKLNSQNQEDKKNNYIGRKDFFKNIKCKKQPALKAANYYAEQFQENFPSAFEHVTEARLSGTSRLVFHIAKRLVPTKPTEEPIKIKFDLFALTDWRDFDLVVTRRAERFEYIAEHLEAYSAGIDQESPPPPEEDASYELMQRRRKKYLLFQGIDGESRDWKHRMQQVKTSMTREVQSYETSIELPFRMYLSPESAVTITARQKPFISERFVRPLWKAELEQRTQDEKRGLADVRAIASDDFVVDVLLSSNETKRAAQPTMLPYAPWSEKPGSEKFLNSLSAFDRHQLVHLSVAHGLPSVPRTVPDKDDERSAILQGVKQLDANQYKVPDDLRLDHTLLDINETDFQVMYEPQPLGVQELSLTALGANLDLEAKFEPPAPLRTKNNDNLYYALSVERYKQRIALGRDIETEVVYKGFLFPLGMRAALIKRTTREIHNRPGETIPRAYLVQRMFLKVGKPDKAFPAINQQFDGRKWPVNRLTLLTTQTPFIENPLDTELSACSLCENTKFSITQGGRLNYAGEELAGLAFWPRTRGGSEGEFKFEFTIDDSGEAVKLPLMFVDNGAAHEPETVKHIVEYYQYVNKKEWADFESNYVEKNKRSLDKFFYTIVSHRGVKRRYAKEEKPGDSTLKTLFWSVGVEGRGQPAGSTSENGEFRMNDPEMEGADQPPFYPTIEKAQVVSQQLERLTGTSSTAALAKFHPTYIRNGFEDNFNPAETILDFYDENHRPELQLSDNGSARGNRTGGIGQPNTEIHTFSRKFGPIGEMGGGQKTASLRQPGPRFASIDANNRDIDYDIITGSTTNTNFDLGNFFGDNAKLLGIVSFKDLFDLKNIPSDNVPNLRELVNYAFGGADVDKELFEPIHELFAEPRSDTLRELNQTLNVIKDVYPNIGTPAKEITDVIKAWEKDHKAKWESQGTPPDQAVLYVSKLVPAFGQLIKEIKISAANPVAPLRDYLEGFVLDRFKVLFGGFIALDPNDTTLPEILQTLVDARKLKEKLFRNLIPALCNERLEPWRTSVLGVPAGGVLLIAAKVALNKALENACRHLIEEPPAKADDLKTVVDAFRDNLKTALEKEINLIADDVVKRELETIRDELAFAIDNAIDPPMLKRASAFWQRIYKSAGSIEEKLDSLRERPSITELGSLLEQVAKAAVDVFVADAERELSGVSDILGAYAISELRSKLKDNCEKAAKLLAKTTEGAFAGQLKTKVQILGVSAQNADDALQVFIDSLDDDFGGTLPAGKAPKTREVIEKEWGGKIRALKALQSGIKSEIDGFVGSVEAAAETIDATARIIVANNFAGELCKELLNGKLGKNLRALQTTITRLEVFARDLKVGVSNIWTLPRREAWMNFANTLQIREQFLNELSIAVQADITDNVKIEIDAVKQEIDKQLSLLAETALPFISDNLKFITVGTNLANAVDKADANSLNGYIELMESVSAVLKEVPESNKTAANIRAAIDQAVEILKNTQNSFDNRVTPKLKSIIGPDVPFRERGQAALTLIRMLPGAEGALSDEELTDIQKDINGLARDIQSQLEEAAWQFLVGGAEMVEGLLEAVAKPVKPVVETILNFEQAIFDQRVEVVKALSAELDELDPKKKSYLRIFLEIFSLDGASTPADRVAKLFWVRESGDETIPSNLSKNPNAKFKDDILGREIDKLEDLKNSLKEAEYQATAQELEELWARWNADKTVAGLVMVQQIFKEIVNLRKFDLNQIVDFDALRKSLENYLLSMVPSRIDLGYSFAAKFGNNQFIKAAKPETGDLHQIPQLAPYFKKQEDTTGTSTDVSLTGGVPVTKFINDSSLDFLISAHASINVLKSEKPKFRVNAIAKPLQLKLIGDSFHALTITFHGAAFETTPDGGSSFYTRIADVTPGPQLKFLEKLAKIMNPGKSGPYLQPLFSPLGIEVGYRLSIGTIPFGGLLFSNIFFSAGCILPFDNSRAKFTVALSSRASPFLISAPPYGGGGFIRIVADAENIISLEASLEFGGVAPFTFGPLAGQGRITAGFYIRQGQVRSFMQGFFFAGGSAQIACFGISASIFIGLSSHGSDMVGVAVFKFSFSVGFVDIEFEVKAEHRQSGGSSENDQQTGSYLITPQNAPRRLAFLFDGAFYQQHAELYDPDERYSVGDVQIASSSEADPQLLQMIRNREIRCKTFKSTKDLSSPTLNPETPVRAVAAVCKSEDWLAHTDYFHTDLLQPLEGI